MKNLFYLTAPILILAFVALGCSNDAPTATKGNELVPQKDMPTVSSEDESVPQLTHGVEGNPTGSCCPEGFVLELALGDPANLNGDQVVCRRVTVGGTVTIDNNFPGNCSDGCPPNCGGGD